MPTFIGKPVTVAEDKQLQVGDILRDFNLTATDLSQKTLSEFDGKKKVISILPDRLKKLLTFCHKNSLSLQIKIYIKSAQKNVLLISNF